MNITQIKALETARTLTRTLVTSDNVAINLTTATRVDMKLKLADGTTYTRAATIVSPISGSVSYDLTAEDSAVVGLARIQFNVTFDDGLVLKVPTEDFDYLAIQESL